MRIYFPAQVGQPKMKENLWCKWNAKAKAGSRRRGEGRTGKIHVEEDLLYLSEMAEMTSPAAEEALLPAPGARYVGGKSPAWRQDAFRRGQVRPEHFKVLRTLLYVEMQMERGG